MNGLHQPGPCEFSVRFAVGIIDANIILLDVEPQYGQGRFGQHDRLHRDSRLAASYRAGERMECGLPTPGAGPDRLAAPLMVGLGPDHMVAVEQRDRVTQ